jgi:hypothetical protein
MSEETDPSKTEGQGDCSRSATGSGAVGRHETRQQTEYLDHVAYCKRCKISGGRGRETIRHCATGELLEVAAVLSAIGGKRPNVRLTDDDEQPAPTTRKD